MLTYKRNTILVLDDEIGPQEAIRMILKDKYNVFTSSEPAQAIELIRSQNVDVLLLDIKMPKVDGLKFLKAVKEAGVNIEVILITGYPSANSAIEAMHCGAYDYIVKPFNSEKIQEVVAQALTFRLQKKIKTGIISGLVSEVYKQLSRRSRRCFRHKILRSFKFWVVFLTLVWFLCQSANAFGQPSTNSKNNANQWRVKNTAHFQIMYPPNQNKVGLRKGLW